MAQTMVLSPRQDYLDPTLPLLYLLLCNSLFLFHKFSPKIIIQLLMFLKRELQDSFIINKFPIRQMTLLPIQIFLTMKGGQEPD